MGLRRSDPRLRASKPGRDGVKGVTDELWEGSGELGEDVTDDGGKTSVLTVRGRWKKQ